MQISVIIPNNNTLQLLHRMIQSIPDSPEVQIIVVDNSPQPLAADDIIGDRTNVEVYYSDPARGAGGARNEGLQHVSGRWILCADADDFYTTEAFDIISKDLDSDCDVIYYGWTSCYSDTLEPADRNYVVRQYIQASLKGDDTRLRYHWDSPCGKLVSAELVRQHNIQFEECPAGNDMGFAVRVGTYAHKVKAVDKAVYCATISDGSIIHTTSKRNAESRFKATVRLNNFLKSQGLRQYRHSVMRQWLQSWHHGPVFALKLLFHSWRQGNPITIGSSRWLKTLRTLKREKPKV